MRRQTRRRPLEDVPHLFSTLPEACLSASGLVDPLVTAHGRLSVGVSRRRRTEKGRTFALARALARASYQPTVLKDRHRQRVTALNDSIESYAQPLRADARDSQADPRDTTAISARSP